MNITATREIYWNVGFPGIKILMVVLAFVPVVYVIARLRRRWRMWRALGTPEPFPPRAEWWPRARRVLTHTLGQYRIRRRTYAGLMHGAIFFSFLLLFIGTVIVAIQSDLATPLLGWYFFRDAFYRVFSVVLELAGIAGIAGCALALYRRYVIRKPSLGGRIDWTSTVWYLLVILLSGFVVEGARIAATMDGYVAEIQGETVFLEPATFEPTWSFVGAGLASLIPAESARALHMGTWWGHLLISIWFLCTFAERAMGHLFTASYAIFMAREIPGGATPRPIPDIENTEVFGVLAIDQFRQSHLRDADSCVECGRCQDVCPAWITGKPLSPKKIVNKLRDAWEPLALAKLAGQPAPEQPELVGGVITADELWACTTCGACEQACPVMIEQVEKIVDMRRGLVLMKSEFPHEVQTAFSNLEQAGNPWGKPAEDRAKWTGDVDFDVPIWGEEGAADAEYLFWVGCAGSYDARSQVITKSFARLLHRAGVKFAILGPGETCNGDPALRIGNEYLYQMLAKQNIETLQAAAPKKIVTACPHCFQTVGKDYKALGGDFDVIHHSELLAELVAAGRLGADAAAAVGAAADAKDGGRAAVFHDSCYLARHNKVIDEPRAVVTAALGGRAAEEPARNKLNGLCCGAGGGRMWMEETLGHTHVNTERATELLSGGADTIVTSCPFCKTMLGDATKDAAKGRDVAVMDIAELLDRATAGATAGAGAETSSSLS